MASGYGVNGTLGRCYWFWRDFIGCITDHPERTEGIQCLPYRDDYLECIQGNKRFDRTQRIGEQIRINQQKAKEHSEQQKHGTHE